MKRSAFTLALCITLYSAYTASGQQKTGTTEKKTATPLQISLKTDKASCVTGEEIHFTIAFRNVSSHPLRILLDHEFVGSNMQCTDSAGNRYAYEGGYLTWSPKAGLYTGRTWLIPPDSTLELKLEALLSDHYSLIFSNRSERRGSLDFQDIKHRLHLPGDFPDKYISAGRIFRLPGAGTYLFTYLYQATENDKYWRFSGAKTPEEASTEDLWTGSVSSNTITLSLK